MTASPTPPTVATAPRWMRVALVASLALNLLIAGLVLGAALGRDGPGRGPRPVELAMGPIARALPPEDRRAILQALRDRPDLDGPGRGRHGPDLSAIAAAIRLEPFDTARVRAALSEQSGRVVRLQEAVQAALVDRLAAMTPDARAAIADRLTEDGPP